ATAGHHVEVAHAAVRTGLGVAEVARNSLVRDRIRALCEEQGHVSDPVWVALDPLLNETVGSLLLRDPGDLLAAHEDLLERILSSGCGGPREQVDRAACT